jgi:endonuclease/exonuclease/phosphatase family metal-dependent hydrolase
MPATSTPTPTPVRDTLHLAAWNLNHRTGKKAIPPGVIDAIAALDIDVLVLTEFVDGDHHARFKDALRDIGLKHLAVSVKASRQNQVLMAAREPLAEEGGLPLPGHTESATTNWLHRRLPSLHLEVVGFRAPMYLDADDRLGYWRQVEEIARIARDRPVIFLGDFRCDPHTDTRPCAALFPRLTADGFNLAQPKGDWSYHAPGKDSREGTRVDHAITTPALRITDARYLYRAGRHTLAGPAIGHGDALSDHALLSIRLQLPIQVDQRTRLQTVHRGACTTRSAVSG